MVLALGVDLGGTKIGVGLVNEAGSLVEHVVRETNAQRGPDAVINDIVESLDEVRSKASNAEVVGIGIGSPGPLDHRKGVVLSPPNLPGWDKVPLRSIVQNKLGLPTMLNNDANVAGIAEYWYGAGEQCGDMVYVTVSTGIGAGIIINGHLANGQNGYAGEIGHMRVHDEGELCSCGKNGCLEAHASGWSIGHRATRLLRRPLSAKDVADLAARGDRVAVQILDDAFRDLGRGLAMVVDLLNPARIVIGGGVSQVGHRLFSTVREEVRKNSVAESAASVKILPSYFGTNAGVLGAASLVMTGLGDFESIQHA